MPYRATPGVLTIYGDSRSGNCQKVKWTAQLLGHQSEWVEVDITRGETRTDEFQRLNPSGQVPSVILPDGRALAQSNAIITYLADGSALIPEDAYERAKMFQWMFWEQYSHEPYIAVRRWRKHFLKQGEDEMDETLLPKGRRALGVMEMALLTNEFLVGSALTLADVALVAYTRLAHEGGFDLSEFPAVRAWVHRVERELGLEPVQEAA
jgi:glutathione S-transferase